MMAAGEFDKNPLDVNVRLKFPDNFTNTYITNRGHMFSPGPRRIIEVTEEEAAPMYRLGFTKV